MHTKNIIWGLLVGVVCCTVGIFFYVQSFSQKSVMNIALSTTEQKLDDGAVVQQENDAQHILSPTDPYVISSKTNEHEDVVNTVDVDVAQEEQQQKNETQDIQQPIAEEITTNPTPTMSWSMKLVNETVSDADLAAIAALGITIVGGEWGMDEASPQEVLGLLDRVAKHDMKFVMNFSDGAGWGYAEDGSDDESQKPQWQGDRAIEYVQTIQHHPALYAYDISNEAGENLPNGETMRITAAQMRAAYSDIKQADPSRPVIIRMHYWDEYDGDFGWRNPFESGIADIVMLNLYSNYTNNRQTPTVPDMVVDSGQELVNTIKQIDSSVEIWIALGAFREMPYFVKPTAEDLQRDIAAARTIEDVANIGFFGWGPERYPNEGMGWYLPRDGTDLLDVIKHVTANGT